MRDYETIEDKKKILERQKRIQQWQLDKIDDLESQTKQLTYFSNLVSKSVDSYIVQRDDQEAQKNQKK